MAETPMCSPTAKNIYAKLQEARARFLAAGAKKSGINRHAEFTYFELSDIVPIATKIFSDLSLTFLVNYTSETADGILIDIDDPTQQIVISFPMAHIVEPSKFRMNEVQSLGAEITYTRRYLYMLLLDIVEADVIDAGDGPKETKTPESEPEKPKAEPKKKAAAPKTKEERKAIKEELTSEETPATDAEREEVRGLMTRVLNAFPDQEEFLMEIMEKTDGLEKLTAIQAAQIKEGLEVILSEVA